MGGTSEVYRGIRDYYKYNIKDASYHSSRTDNEERWAFIHSHLSSDVESLVDIGCADGFFVEKAAAAGIFVSGIEGNQSRVDRARNRTSEYDNVDITHKYLAPDNIDNLPSSDAVLFLTVHHHWIRQYGWEAAAEMFRNLSRQTDIVFYEPPGNKTINRDGSESSLAPEQSIEYYEDEIVAIFEDHVNVVDVEMFEYGSSDRSDPIFVIDTSQVT